MSIFVNYEKNNNFVNGICIIVL